jgi:hypothetical protein
MDNRKVTIAAFLDLSAAFDLVDHGLLMSKLRAVGVDEEAWRWFQTYLADRSYAVTTDNKQASTTKNFECGVPQGSVLGPILFTVYLIGIEELFRGSEISYVIYADDIHLSISASVDDLHTAATKLAAKIMEIKLWLQRNGLILNENKTECVLFGTAPLLAKCSLTHLRLGNHDIQLSNSTRYLGVILDSSLTMDEHIRKVCRESFGYMRAISRQRKAMDNTSLRMLLNSLVLSRIEYASSLLFGVNKSLLKRLEAVSNSALRIVARKRKFDHLTEARLQHLWLPVESRQIIRILVLVYTSLHSRRPAYLADILQLQENRHTRSQTQQLLVVPRTAGRMADRSFSVAGPSLWNTIPLSIRQASRVEVFRTQVTKFLQEKMMKDP